MSQVNFKSISFQQRMFPLLDTNYIVISTNYLRIFQSYIHVMVYCKVLVHKMTSTQTISNNCKIIVSCAILPLCNSQLWLSALLQHFCTPNLISFYLQEGDHISYASGRVSIKCCFLQLFLFSHSFINFNVCLKLYFTFYRQSKIYL